MLALPHSGDRRQLYWMTWERPPVLPIWRRSGVRVAIHLCFFPSSYLGAVLLGSEVLS